MSNNPSNEYRLVESKENKKKTSRRSFLLGMISMAMTGGVVALATQSQRDVPQAKPAQAAEPPTEVPPAPTATPAATAELERPPQAIFHFETFQEARDYLLQEELAAGFDRANMSLDQLRERRGELREHPNFTLGFVIGGDIYKRFILEGKDPQAMMVKQLERLNTIYEEADLPVRYTLQPTIVIYQPIHSADVHHTLGDGIQLNSTESLPYSWMNDITWVIADDPKAEEEENQDIKFLLRPNEEGEFYTLHHELVHQLGMRDLYRDIGRFREGSLKRIWTYQTDMMCNSQMMQLTPASALGIAKILELKNYGLQHDGHAYFNPEKRQVLWETIAPQYFVSFKDTSGNVLDQSVSTISITKKKDENNYFVDMHEETFSRSSAGAVVLRNQVERSIHTIFDIGQMRLPIDRMHFIYTNLYNPLGKDVVHMPVTVTVDPETFVGDGEISIEMVDIGDEANIQEEYFGKKVIAYSQVAETGVYSLWLVNQSPQ